MIPSGGHLGKPVGPIAEADVVMTESSMVPVFAGTTADTVWRLAAEQFRSGAAIRQQSRGGETYELLHTVMAVSDPRQRWTPSRWPAMNPAFAIAEVVWMLAGRNDAAMVNFFNPQLPRFAGNRDTYSGAYGNRLRRAFGLDQLARASEALANNPDSRQVVLQIWNAESDLPDQQGSPASPDVPCNLLSLLKVREGRLDWTQILRSNDLVLGVPHNIVQFTYLQEVVAGWLNLEMGQYTHVSDSLHVYDRDRCHLNARTVARPETNTDSVALSYEVSALAWAELERRTDELTSPELTQALFDRLLQPDGLPHAFGNLLVILGADSARRRGWKSQMVAAAARCTNPALTQLWRSWLSRVGLRGRG